VFIILSSDGSGRSGTFISIYSEIERLKTEGVVDVLQCIKSARIQRCGLVANEVRSVCCCCCCCCYFAVVYLCEHRSSICLFMRLWQTFWRNLTITQILC